MKKESFNHGETKQRFTIRKYSFGVVSALLATLFIGGVQVQASEARPNTDLNTVSTEQMSEVVPPAQDDSVEETEPVNEMIVPEEVSEEVVNGKTSVENNETTDTLSQNEKHILVDEVSALLADRESEQAFSSLDTSSEPSVVQPELQEDLFKSTEDSVENHKQVDLTEAVDVKNPKTQATASNLQNPARQDGIRMILQFEEENRAQVIEQLACIEDTEIKYQYNELLTGLSVTTTPQQFDLIKNIPGLTAVELSRPIRPRMHTAKQLIHAIQESPKYQHDGRGMVIALVDSGVDTKHKDMRLDDDVVPKIKTIKESVEGTYTIKIPHGYSFVTNNNDLLDQADSHHGMHIAGILAGNATDEEVANKKGIDGIAPNAQLFVYRIFSDKPDMFNAGSEDTAYAAIEDAVKHGADVISLSIGLYDNGRPGNTYYKIAEKAAERGIVIAAAMGNSGTSSSSTSYDLASNNALGMVDTSAIVGVAATPYVIGVGSARNTHIFRRQLTIDNQTLDYHPIGNSKIMEGEYHFVDVGNGIFDEIQDLDLSNKIAIVQRSDHNLTDIVRQLKLKDIAGMIYVNTNTGRNRDYYRTHLQYIDDERIFSYTDVWGVTMTGGDGERLTTYIKENEGPHVLKVNPNGVTKQLIQTPTISGFSSWGPTIDLHLKPEIVAPGEDIYSTFNGDRYAILSGTSMASPIVAGASTILLPKVREMNHPEGISTVNLLRILLMNTAEPLIDRINHNQVALEYSPRQQGAGMLNLQKAFNSDVILYHNQKGAVELKEIGQHTEFEVTIHNLGKEKQSFTVSSGKVLTSKDFPVTKDLGNGKTTIVNEIHAAEISESDLVILTPTIELQPNEVKTLKFRLNTSDAKQQFAEGYIYLKSNKETQADLSIPYFGFVGDWSGERLIDAPAWDETAKTGLTTLMASFKHSKDGKMVVLGSEDIHNPHSKINPDAIAMNSLSDTQNFLGSPTLRYAVLRDVVGVDIDIVGEPTPDAPVLKRMDTVTMLSKFRNVSYYEDELYRRNVESPTANLSWDGKLFNATTGEYEPVLEGRYYFRIRAKNKDNGPYQYTYLPVKIDNTKPTDLTIDTARLDSDGIIKIFAKDNQKIWYMRAVLNNQVIPLEKVEDQAGEALYLAKDLPIAMDKMNHLTVEAMDIAGNVTQKTITVKEPLILFDNLEVLSDARESLSSPITAQLQHSGTRVHILLNDLPIAVKQTEQKIEADFSDMKDGKHVVTVVIEGEAGNDIWKQNYHIIRDRVRPKLSFDVKADEDNLLEINHKGRFTIKGHVTDDVSKADELKVIYYDPSTTINRRELVETAKHIPLNEDGTFSIDLFKSDFPNGIILLASDEKGNRTSPYRFYTDPSQLEWHFGEFEPVTVHNYILPMNQLYAGNIGRETRNGTVDFKKLDNGKFEFTFEIEKDDDRAYYVSVNNGEKVTFDDEDMVRYPITLEEAFNVANLNVYNKENQLVFAKKYHIYVDVTDPELTIDNKIVPIEATDDVTHRFDDDHMQDGYLYANHKGELTLTGTAKDNGVYWHLLINGHFVQRGGIWREYGNNEKAYQFTLHELKDNDHVFYELGDSFGNQTKKHFRVIVDSELPELKVLNDSLLEGHTYVNQVVIPLIEAKDNIGIKQVDYLLNNEIYQPGTPISELGDYTLVVTAQDYAGNIIEKQFDFQVKGLTDKIEPETIPDLPIATVLGIEWVDQKGQALVAPVIREIKVGESYQVDTVPLKVEGVTYRFVNLASDTAPLSGQAKEGINRVVLVYEKEIVDKIEPETTPDMPIATVLGIEWVDQKGQALVAPVIREIKVGESYKVDTAPLKVEGATYRFVKLKSESAPLSGQAQEGINRVVLVYEKEIVDKIEPETTPDMPIATVLGIEWVDQKGQALVAPVIREIKVGESYKVDTAPLKVEGATYRFVKLKSESAPLSGQAQEGINRVVLVYEKVSVLQKPQGMPNDLTPNPVIPAQVKDEEENQEKQGLQETLPVKDESNTAQAQLPNTGESVNSSIFTAASLAILSGLGFIVTSQKKEKVVDDTE